MMTRSAGSSRWPEQLHGDRRAGVDDLGVLIDRDEPVGAAESGTDPSPSHRIRGKSAVTAHQADEQVFGSSALGIHPHR
jgi:hypothetical protein